MRSLCVTNDFPPRAGGIQAFVHGVLVRQPEGSVVVYAPRWKGDAAFDAEQPFPVIRHRSSLMLPEPTVVRRAREIARSEGCDRVVFGAAAPLGLLAPWLASAGVHTSVGITHGHEAAWAQTPGSRQLLRRIGEGLNTVTFLGSYTRTKIASALTPQAAARMRQLVPGVDSSVFHPDRHEDGRVIRQRHGLGDRRVVVCVSRLMPRKGQDSLIRALPRLHTQIGGDVALLIVGGGPYRKDLEALVAEHGLGGDVVITGGVPWEELPAHYAAGDVFAMPCRTRQRGWDVEGLGIVYLEASATGLAVVSGDSGGAPDAVREGETGFIVGGRDQDTLVDRLAQLLSDPELAGRMGRAGRQWVESSWGWDRSAERLRKLLAGRDPDA
ncbi:MAG: glycosyltransferase family 4 protein [Candidatus Nanopelagicales bacterium]